MRLAFRIAYFGTGFSGSQQQTGKRTVMDDIIKSLTELNLFSDRQKARIYLSGRTDRGVHARCQVISFTTPYPERAVLAINKKLPGDIRFTGWAEVDENFNPRLAAKKRTYRYYFYGTDYDIEKMRQSAAYFEGRHNFTRFARLDGKSPHREILSCDVFTEDGFTVFEITGVSFLWNMVRCMSHALMLAGRGEIEPVEIRDSLLNTEGHRYPAAPPEGLVLWDVDCGIVFTPIDVHRKSISHQDEILKKYAQLKKTAELW
ncbi:tRNA pseudouridine(38-40) synthase TruA [Methanoplanus sp. FWC-SCC4]|uniref:tRNA pseudouridine synthase A n=1 Tax=Methanochimaera problematica TaxID=2609417 RepID=A0AA97FD11_9EURY|nr:tRNA pseudouridine(38-40) synthase TruA [Methanoplanus sp. FWC-SCC4]WOF16704.1 tRNA pseudouridine(38-40) synthase TruA [Methanoplanus sp. FWC-SCC4]